MEDIKNLLQNDGYSIYTFTPGDIIIRVLPAIFVEEIYDTRTMKIIEIKNFSNSYKLPMIFKGISNNLIYLQYYTGPLKGTIVTASLSIYSDNWDYFKLPDGIDINDVSF